MTYPFGVDLSKHQGVNDYAKMKATTAGIKLVLILLLAKCCLI